VLGNVSTSLISVAGQASMMVLALADCSLFLMQERFW
jgi:hypothetical protein